MKDAPTSPQEFAQALGEAAQKSGSTGDATAAKAALKGAETLAVPVDPKAGQAPGIPVAQEKKKQVSADAAALAQAQAAGVQAAPTLPNPMLQAAQAMDAQESANKLEGAKMQKSSATPSGKLELPAGMKDVKGDTLDPKSFGAKAPDANALAAELSQAHGPGSEFSVHDELGLQEMKFEGAGMQGESGKGAVSASQTTQAAVKPTAVSSTLSTDDYLNMRNFGAGTMKKSPAKLTLNTAELGQPGSAISGAMMGKDHGANPAIATIDAPVTTGHMQRPVLSHDAVHQMTQQMGAMNLAKQDGEIKIRLKPDHLGELKLNVRNNGQQISIQIQAQDAESRNIIESSLSSLRDSLSQHNLTVARVEVTQAAPHAPQAVGQDGAQMQMDLSQFRQQGSDGGFQQQSHQESLANRNYWREEESGRSAAIGGMSAARGRAATSTANGLDLIA